MKKFNLEGEIRNDFGKSAARSYRNNGMVPCVIYGGSDEENVNFVVKQGDVRDLIYTPEVFLVNIDLGKDKYKAVLKEVQFHPVREQILHIDFLYVFDSVPVEIDIPVRLEGLAIGVRDGGKLSQHLRKLKVRGLADKLPEELVLNVENLKLGDSIQVADLDFEGLELLNPEESVVCRVHLTRVVLSAAEEAAEEEEGEEVEEGEEGSEGADTEETSAE